MAQSSTTFRLVVICLCKQSLSDSVYTEPVLLGGFGWGWGVRSRRGVAASQLYENTLFLTPFLGCKPLIALRNRPFFSGRRRSDVIGLVSAAGLAKPNSLSGVYENLHPVIKPPIFGAV